MFEIWSISLVCVISSVFSFNLLLILYIQENILEIDVEEITLIIIEMCMIKHLK